MGKWAVCAFLGQGKSLDLFALQHGWALPWPHGVSTWDNTAPSKEQVLPVGLGTLQGAENCF